MRRLIDFCFSDRRGLAVALAAAVGAGAVVAWAEHWAGMEPCSLCWTQRLFMGLFAVAALAGFVAWPKGRAGKTLLGVPLLGTALAGAAVAVRHLYVIWNPEVAECGMSPEVMVQILPWHKLLLELITGNTDCAEASHLLGVPLPLWSLFGFLALAALSAYALIRRSPSL
mgnify:CR=1 FL=1